MTPELRVPAAHLDTPDDAALVWRAIERVYGAVSDGAIALAKLSDGQRALYALHWCVAEVSNGGFDQFLTNWNSAFADETVVGFERIGAWESAEVLRNAIDVFASRPPDPDLTDPEFDEAADAEAFDAYRSRHAPLEDRFHALSESELYPRAAAYVRAHLSEFAL